MNSCTLNKDIIIRNCIFWGLNGSYGQFEHKLKVIQPNQKGFKIPVCENECFPYLFNVKLLCEDVANSIIIIFYKINIEKICNQKI